jgi:hypothetical protein
VSIGYLTVSVCELGGGMTCLAGIAVSIIQLIKYLLIYPFSWWIIGKISDLIKEIIICVPNISTNQMTNFSTFYYSVKENYQLKAIVQKMTIWIDNSTHVKKITTFYFQNNKFEIDFFS